MASAVSSMSVSGRRLLRTIAMPTTARAIMMTTLTSRSIRRSQPTVRSMFARLVPTTRMTRCEDADCWVRSFVSVTVTGFAMTCQLALPPWPATVASWPWLACSQLLLVGTDGPGRFDPPPNVVAPNGWTTCPLVFSSSTR